MELEDVVVYESNVAYQTHKEFTQYKDCSGEMVPTEAGNYSKNNKTVNGLKTSTELFRIKKLLIAMILLVVVLAAITLTATIFSALSYGLSQANNEPFTGFQLDESIQKKLTGLQIQLYCGAGQWHRIAFLNMTDPSQQCPSAWREYNTSGVRACGRKYSTEGSCSSSTYKADSVPYRRVCGQVIGYQVGSPDAFNEHRFLNHIDMDGINITHVGIPYYHIWSFVGGLTENSSLHRRSSCPCSSISDPYRPPPYTDNNYHCESGNPTESFENNQVFSSDPIWDGKKCEGTCCIGAKNPPWFSVQLPAPTTDMIEVSICADESTDNEDTPIELLEIYIQ